MESIIRNVKDIDGDHRHWLESALGRQLHDNQQVVIRVLEPGVEPNESVRDQALGEACEIAKQGRENAAAQGVTAAEANCVIDEEIQQVRQQKQR